MLPETVVHEFSFCSSPMAFKGDQPLVVHFGPAKVELLCSPFPGIPYRPPEQEGHTAQIMQFGIRTSVLVHDAFLVVQRQHTGDRLAVLQGDPDQQIVSKGQISGCETSAEVAAAIGDGGESEAGDCRTSPTLTPTFLLAT